MLRPGNSKSPSEDASSPTVSQATTTTACETCRNKKRKCDHQKPTCGQCKRSGILCNYLKANRRGFPTGYLAALEQRLCDTEIALVETLSLLDRAQANQYPRFEQQDISAAFRQRDEEQSKSARVDEWGQLPLYFHEQRLSWYEAKLKSLDPAKAGSISMTDPATLINQQTLQDSANQYSAQVWQSSPPMPTTSRSQSFHGVGDEIVSFGGQDMMAPAFDDIPAGNTALVHSKPSRAQDLSVRNPSRFF